jgi:hypothetical protein
MRNLTYPLYAHGDAPRIDTDRKAAYFRLFTPPREDGGWGRVACFWPMSAPAFYVARRDYRYDRRGIGPVVLIRHWRVRGVLPNTTYLQRTEGAYVARRNRRRFGDMKCLYDSMSSVYGGAPTFDMTPLVDRRPTGEAIERIAATADDSGEAPLAALDLLAEFDGVWLDTLLAPPVDSVRAFVDKETALLRTRSKQ